jgi:hypothetical protein
VLALVQDPMPIQPPPDYLIRKRVEEDNKYAIAETFARDVAKVQVATEWFEGKIKYDFNEGAKRNDGFIKDEIDMANVELKKRRTERLKHLYLAEARMYEEELRSMGLAVQRIHL